MSRKYIAWKNRLRTPPQQPYTFDPVAYELWSKEVLVSLFFEPGSTSESSWLNDTFDGRRWFPLNQPIKRLTAEYRSASKRRRYRLRGKGHKWWLDLEPDVIDFEKLPMGRKSIAPFIRPLKAD